LSSKDQRHSEEKRTAQRRWREPDLQALEVLLPEQTLGAAVQKARLASSLMTQRDVLQLQRVIGSRAVGSLLTTQARGRPPVSFSKESSTSWLSVQRAVYKEGSKGAAAVPAQAKSIALWVTTKTSIQPGGKLHVTDVHNRGLIGFKKGKDIYVGGRIFNNNPMPDQHRLPNKAGQTYQEWDIHPSQPGQNRGAERIVTGSDGKVYYTNDHYNNFTEFKV
jgi:hypothetical protein